LSKAMISITTESVYWRTLAVTGACAVTIHLQDGMSTTPVHRLVNCVFDRGVHADDQQSFSVHSGRHDGSPGI
jgi:hypothetical protein